MQTTETSSLLEAHKVRKSLESINGWQLTSDHKMIYREFMLPNFIAAVDMIDRIACIAEEEKHHPDLHLTHGHILRVGLTTHAVGGLSERDLIVARKINEVPLLGKALSMIQQLKNKEQSDGDEVKIKEPIKRSHAGVTPKKHAIKTKRMQTKKIINRISKKNKKI